MIVINRVVFVQEHPKASDFRYKPLPCYDDLLELYEGTHATGEYALSSDEPGPADFEAVCAMQSMAPCSDNATGPGQANLADVNGTEPVASALDRDAGGDSGRKKKRESGGVLIADAIGQVAEQMQMRTAKLRALTSSQRAIKLLQRVYKDQYTTSSLVQAFDIMMDDAKAKIFLVMDEGEARDTWVSNQIDAVDEAQLGRPQRH